MHVSIFTKNNSQEKKNNKAWRLGEGEYLQGCTGMLVLIIPEDLLVFNHSDCFHFAEKIAPIT